MEAIQPARRHSGFHEPMLVAIHSILSDRFATVSFPSRLDSRMHDLIYRCESPQPVIYILPRCC
jgi:hypothetical protein